MMEEKGEMVGKLLRIRGKQASQAHRSPNYSLPMILTHL